MYKSKMLNFQKKSCPDKNEENLIKEIGANVLSGGTAKLNLNTMDDRKNDSSDHSSL